MVVEKQGSISFISVLENQIHDNNQSHANILGEYKKKSYLINNYCKFQISIQSSLMFTYDDGEHSFIWLQESFLMSS